MNGTKNEEEAQRFVNWFGSAQIQGEWAEVFSTLPANTNAVGKANELTRPSQSCPHSRSTGHWLHRTSTHGARKSCSNICRNHPGILKFVRLQ